MLMCFFKQFYEMGVVFQFLPTKDLRFLEKRLGLSKVMER